MNTRDNNQPKIIFLPDEDFEISNIRKTHAEALLLHQVSAWLLFPNDDAAKTRQAYVASGINATLLKMLGDTSMSIEKAFVTLCDFLLPLHKPTYSTGEDENSLDLHQNVRLAWSAYQESLRHANFPKKGKGSIAERVMRGRMAGWLLSIALLKETSLAKAADQLAAEIPEIRATLFPDVEQELPTVTQDNLLRNIWPEFKSVAHIWVGLQDFHIDVPEDPTTPYLFDLMDLMEGDSPIWPARWHGWRNLVHKSNAILHHCVDQGPVHKATHPLLRYDECIRLLIR